MGKESTYELIKEIKSENVDWLYSMYGKDKYAARVMFMNGTCNDFEQSRLVVFREEKSKNYELCFFIRKYGISKTNKMYSRERKYMSIRRKNGKLYLIHNRYMKPLTITNLRNLDLYTHNGMIKAIIDFLSKEYSWINFMIEHNVLHDTTFNTIIDKKLYSLKKALQYQYKVPYPIAKLMHKSTNESHHIRYIKYYLEYIDKIENIKPDWISGNMRITFYDTLKMGKTLNRKVNCSWSNRRLVEEHDKWSKEITKIIYTVGDREMKVGEIFLKFAQESGFPLFTRTKEMANEGIKQNHCVVTYISYVNRGNCGIFHIDGYTLELAKVSRGGKYSFLKMNQFRGYGNSEAPEELRKLVQTKVTEFNFKLIKHYKSNNKEFDAHINEKNDIVVTKSDEVPFNDNYTIGTELHPLRDDVFDLPF